MYKRQLQGQLDEVSAKLEELAEENGGEDGLFAQLDDLKKATISARIKAIKKDPAAKEELAALKEYMSLLDAESNYKKAIKQAEADLDTKLEKKYSQLTLEEIRHLLVEEKWFAAIYSGIDAIHETVSHHLSALSLIHIFRTLSNVTRKIVETASKTAPGRARTTLSEPNCCLISEG